MIKKKEKKKTNDEMTGVSQRHGAVDLDGFYFVVFILILRNL